MEDATGGTHSWEGQHFSSSWERIRFKQRPIFEQIERMTGKQLSSRSGRIILLAFRLGKKTTVIKLFTILG